MSLMDELAKLPPAITIRQAADLLQVDPKFIRRLIADGTIRAYRIGHRTVRVDRDDLVKVIKPL